MVSEASDVLRQAREALARANAHTDPMEILTEAVVALERAMLAERLAQEGKRPDILALARTIHQEAGALIDAIESKVE